MSAPGVNIAFANGALGQVAGSADGVFGLMATGAAVASTFALATPYTLRSRNGLATLGITTANNPSIYKLVNDYYDEAGEGAEMGLMAFPDTVKMSDMVSMSDATKAQAFINAMQGRLRALFISRAPAVGYTPVITNGLDADVALARTNATLVANWARDTKKAPVFVVIEGYGYSGSPVALADLTTGSDRNVAIMIGNTASATGTTVPAAIGLLMGRLASNPIQSNIGQVKDGPVATLTAYLANTAVESADWESIHNKGYITFRTFASRSGYFFVDDPTATLPTDDYNHLTAVRTIQKAFRLAHDVLLEKLVSNVPVNGDGTLQLALCKAWQADVERAIATGMTSRGELSADVTKGDKGVRCFIDPNQVVSSTSTVNVVLQVRPYGYARTINVQLGFQPVA